MAISIYQNTSGWQPAYNDLVWVVGSDLAASKYNFKYVCNIYATDGVTLLATLKSYPRVDSPSGFAYFNIKRIIENYVSDDFNAVTFPLVIDVTNGRYNYGLKFAEEYSNTPDGELVIPTSGITAMQSGWVWGASLEFKDFIDYKQSDYCVDTSGNTAKGRWLTNMPTTPFVEVGDNEKGWLYAIRKLGQTDPQYIVITLSTSGTTVNRFIEWNDEKMIRIPAAPQSLREYFGEAFTDLKDYGILGTNVEGGDFFYNITFKVVNRCGIYDKQRIHFLNRLGGYDSFTFTMKSEVSSNIERKTYGHKLGELFGGQYRFGYLNRGVVVSDTREKRMYRFNSDWLTEAQATWLNELITSPKIFYDDGRVGNISITPLNVDTNSFVFRKKQNEKLFQLEFTASFTTDEIRQRY